MPIDPREVHQIMTLYFLNRAVKMVRMLSVPQPILIIITAPTYRAKDPAVPIREHGAGLAIDNVGDHDYWALMFPVKKILPPMLEMKVHPIGLSVMDIGASLRYRGTCRTRRIRGRRGSGADSSCADHESGVVERRMNLLQCQQEARRRRQCWTM